MRLLRHVMMKKGAIAVSTAYFIVFLTFLTAYANPSKSVRVTVDDYNEANIELVLMVLTLPAAMRFLVDELKVIPEAGGTGAPTVINPHVYNSGSAGYRTGNNQGSTAYTPLDYFYPDS